MKNNNIVILIIAVGIIIALCVYFIRNNDGIGTSPVSEFHQPQDIEFVEESDTGDFQMVGDVDYQNDISVLQFGRGGGIYGSGRHFSSV